MRRLPLRQIEHHLVDIAPASALRRIVTLDDRVPGGVEMSGRVLVRRIVAAADMAAAAANPQMQPHAAALEAFLATECARRDVADASYVRAALGHARLTPLWCRRKSYRRRRSHMSAHPPRWPFLPRWRRRSGSLPDRRTSALRSNG